LEAPSDKVLNTALLLLKKGFSVIPLFTVNDGVCACGKPECDRKGKHSPAKWKSYQKTKASEDQVRKWFNQSSNNIGIVTGKISGFLVMDVDVPEGMESLGDRDVPSTVIAETGGGGYHYYFKYPEGREIKSRIKILPDVDIRAEGGYVVAPPSLHESGNHYKWKDGASPGEVEFALPPDWLLELLKPKEKRRADQCYAPVFRGNLLPCAQSFIMRGTNEGTRDSCLFTLAKHCHSAGIDEEEAILRLEQANLLCSPPLKEGDLAVKVNSAYEGNGGEGYTSLGCEEPAWQPFCCKDNSCPVYKKYFLVEEKKWPADLSQEAFHGLAGEVVRTLSPYSEADDSALLLNFLVAFGNVIGRSAHYMTGADKHCTNIYVVLVGETSKGRKGMSWNWIKQISGKVEKSWTDERNASGLTSGEGLIWQVRDEQKKKEPIKNKGGEVTGYQEVIFDGGVSDKRLLVMESEFAQALKVMSRPGNTLSPVIREGWDSGSLNTLVKNNPNKATGAHISIIGHITADELRENLTTTEMVNGFGNRFLWCCVRRSKLLPDGAIVPEDKLADLVSKVKAAVDFAKEIEAPMKRDDEANELWRKVYSELSEGKPGISGAMVGRAEAQVLRLSMVYALLDKSCVIKVAHLKAALAVWKRCEESVCYVFGDMTGSKITDTVLASLKNGPLTQTEISGLFNRNLKADVLNQALESLERKGDIKGEKTKEEGNSKPTITWSLV
jgi:hypothetical protein